MILVTGATGFLGSHLMIELIKSGNKIIALKRKLSSDLEDDRAHQIVQFKREMQLKNWVAIDDLDLSFSLGDHFFKTNSSEGIKQSGLKDKIINKLNG